MKNMLRNAGAALLLLLMVMIGGPALAQSNCSSVIFFGNVPTAAQWQSCFAAKQDNLGFTPLNIAGGTMLGPLVTTPSTNFSAGFNIQPGVVPGSPNNGDMWVTAAGLFVRAGGVTVGPLTGATAGGFAATSPLTVSFPGGVVTYALTTVPPSLGGTGISNSNTSTLTMAGPLATTGTGSVTLAFPNSTVTYTYPTASGTLGAINLAQTWSAAQSFNTGDLLLNGSTSGSLTVNCAATCGSNTLTLPAGTTNFSATGGTSQVVQQTSLGGAFTVGQLAASNLSNGTTGSGAVVLANTPSLTTPALGAATATSINGLTITTTTGTLTIANAKTLTANNSISLSGTDGKTLTLTNSLTVSGNDGTLSFGAASKTLTVNNSLTLAGTDATTMTFPGASDTVMGLGSIQTVTAAKTYNKDTLVETAGNSATTFKPAGLICSGLTSTGNGADGTADPLQTCAVAANTLDAANRGVHLESWGVFASNADTKTVTITWGGTVIYTSTGLTQSGTSWFIWCDIFKTGSNTQTAACGATFGNSVPSTNVNATTITDTSSQNLITTGQSGSSTANDIVSKGQIVLMRN